MVSMLDTRIPPLVIQVKNLPAVPTWRLLASPNAPLHYGNGLFGRTNASEDGRDPVHELAQIVFETRASIADDDLVEVKIPRVIGSAGDADMRGPTAQQNRICSVLSRVRAG
jgi:hypothetical protein